MNVPQRVSLRVPAASCMGLEKPALLELPGWTDDLPQCTSRALLQLLFIHVTHLTDARHVVIKPGEAHFCGCFNHTAWATVQSMQGCA